MNDEELKLFRYKTHNITYFNTNNILPIDPYYIGFWIGDGHSTTPSRFTCGGETKNGGTNDQEFILPYMKNLCNKYKLQFKNVKNGKKKCITFDMNRGHITNKTSFTINKRSNTSKSCITNLCF